ncbi:hypothetical protein ETB97_004531 [Aspergillus alliaceus]|uniref:Uncharacterized protein n=1 Tax=Petromyces alliaceus TaxID=209559 RepID=A0A8H6EB36_PETAA|nr:hypothetical protein ETB97_004531 [Aspergillus burnettii]
MPTYLPAAQEHWPDVKALHGSEVTVKLSKQLEPLIAWPDNSGYLDYVMDDRNMGYWRPYVGQSLCAERRIKQHVKGSAKPIADTLHYFVIQKDNGMRTMDYVRLWSFTDSGILDQETQSIFSKLLEMSFAFAFQSLPFDTLERYFGCPAETSYSDLASDVLAPLAQGISLRSHIRQAQPHQAWKVPPTLISRCGPDLEERPRNRIRMLSNGAVTTTRFRQIDHPFNGRHTLDQGAFDTSSIRLRLAEAVLKSHGRRDPSQFSYWPCKNKGRDYNVRLPDGYWPR